MIDQLLQIIAPHHCSGCDKLGTLLCSNCKYDIISEPYLLCIACRTSGVSKAGICSSCIVPYARAWCVGERYETLERLINAYKFSNAKQAYRPLAELLDDYLPVLPANVVITSVPTVSSHIRQRGYDHMALIAKQLARRRRLPYSALLTRITTTKQREASKRLRVEQAKKAFASNTPLDPETIYLLLDDVVTTGATLKYAVKALKDNGAQAVWVASISRQTLD